MAVAPASARSLAQDRMRDLIASSATFQTWVGAADQAAAKLRVYVSERHTVTRPYALLMLTPYVMTRSGTGTGFMSEVEFELHFLADVDAANDDDDAQVDAQYEFDNAVGDIFTEMFENADGENVDLASIAVDPSMRSDEDENDDFMMCRATIATGGG